MSAAQQSQAYTVLKIATETGPLAQIWLAANMSTIPRGSVLQTSIEESAEEIAKVSGCTPEVSENKDYITLRTSGELLQGIVRVYSKQAGFLLSDIKDTLTKINTLFKIHARVTVTSSRVSTVAKVHQLVLEDTVTEKEVLTTPSLDFLNEKPRPRTLLRGANDVVHGTARTSGGVEEEDGPSFVDTSLEVGRRYNPDGEFEHNSSALDLDFELDNDYRIDTSNEGTRVSEMRSNLSAKMSSLNVANHDEFPPQNNDDDWDLGINDQDNGHDSDDQSVELGRRADEPALDEHTDFGFDLDLGKEIVDQPQEVPAEMVTEQKSTRRHIISDPKLKDAHLIVIDHSAELSRSNFNVSRTTQFTLKNPQNIENAKAQTTKVKKMSQKRLLQELLADMGFLDSSIASSLLDYRAPKRQRTQEPITETTQDEIAPFDISLELNDNSVNNMDMIQDNFDDQEDIDEHQPDFNEDDAAAFNEDFETYPDHETHIEQDGQEIENSNMGTQIIPNNNDNVKLTNGQSVTKAIVKMADDLREHTGTEALHYSDMLSSRVGESNKPTKRDASKCFFDMLTLATAGCIKLNQTSTFEEINVSKRAPLFEKFIPA